MSTVDRTTAPNADDRPISRRIVAEQPLTTSSKKKTKVHKNLQGAPPNPVSKTLTTTHRKPQRSSKPSQIRRNLSNRPPVSVPLVKRAVDGRKRRRRTSSLYAQSPHLAVLTGQATASTSIPITKKFTKSSFSARISGVKRLGLSVRLA